MSMTPDRYRLFTLVGLLLFVAASFSHAATRKDLYELLRVDPLKAKEMLLLNHLEFGGNTRETSLETADALFETGEWEGAAAMYQLWAKLFRRNEPEYRVFEIWAQYLEASLRIYDSYPRYLEIWNKNYSKVKAFAPGGGQVKKTALPFIDKRLDESIKKPGGASLFGKDWLTLARLVELGEQDLPDPMVRSRFLHFLATREQTRYQVTLCNDMIRGLERDNIPVNRGIKERCSWLSKYYSFHDNGRRKIETSPVDACALFDSALAALERARGVDTENVKGNRKSVCVKSVFEKEIRELRPSKIDASADGVRRVDSILEKIERFEKEIAVGDAPPGTAPSSIMAYVQGVREYCNGARALASYQVASPLEMFFKDYNKREEFSVWTNMAGRHLGIYYNNILKSLLKNGPVEKSAPMALQSMASVNHSFETYKNYVVTSDETLMDGGRQYAALIAFRSQVAAGSTEALATSNLLDEEVREAWGVAAALGPILSRERDFQKARKSLALGATAPLENWAGAARSDYDKKRAWGEFATFHHGKLSDLLYKKDREGKRATPSDLNNLKTILAHYRHYKKLAGKTVKKPAEAQADKILTAHDLLARGEVNQAESIFAQLDSKVSPAWRTQEQFVRRKIKTYTTPQAPGAMLEEAARAFFDYRYPEAWEIYKSVYTDLLPGKHGALLIPKKRAELLAPLPDRERGVLEMLARVMAAINGRFAIRFYKEMIGADCQGASCKNRLFLKSAKKSEHEADRFYLKGLREMERGKKLRGMKRRETDESAMKDFLKALSNLFREYAESRGRNERVNHKIESMKNAIFDLHRYMPRESFGRVGAAFWRDPGYEPRGEVVKYLEPFGVKLIEVQSRLILIEKRLADFKSLVDHIVFKNGGRSPGYMYLRSYFSWCARLWAGSPEGTINAIWKSLSQEIKKSGELSLMYDLFLPLAELRRAQGRYSDWFENLLIAYNAVVEYEKDKMRAKEKKDTIKSRLRQIKNLVTKGKFKLRAKEEELLRKNGLDQWWNSPGASPLIIDGVFKKNN